ncbi:hypothetical protein BZA77DRAFT_255248 [Pyronema omphalodes]|nr:hypothetical protein BZA77DRAFT_255248 [Pyronema omphalodes]
MPITTFRAFCTCFKELAFLHDGRKAKVDEQVAIFMDIVGKKACNRSCQKMFQHRGETMNRP